MTETTDPVIKQKKPASEPADLRASSGDFSSPALYVGIGASAGGLSALQTFFARMSDSSGAAFIVVQHLSPDFVSHMDELLSRHTDMAVQVAAHGVNVAPNCVYLIPPKTNITLSGGFLYLSEQVRDGSVNTPIDYFFRSLAEDAKHRCVGIILSGTGSDGSRGLKGIKEAGGLVMVQDRDSSEFDGMPYVAAQTGTADLISPPEELADHLSTFLASSMVKTASMLSLPRIKPDDGSLVRVFALLATHSGIDFSQYESSMVIQRIGRRMSINSVENLSDYLEVLQNSFSEQNRLSHELLVPISAFFRVPSLWDCLRKSVLPSLLESADEVHGLRVWVAGCATGQEAYSLAIIIDEAMRESGKRMPIKLFATDIDKSTIKTAIAGSYGLEIAHDVSSERLSRYFVQSNGQYTVRPDIRASVVFSSHDLLKHAPYPSTDLILCRNVLKYFRARVRMAVLSTFHFSLKENAALVLGSSESIPELHQHFKEVQDTQAYFTKIPGSRFATPRIHLDSSHLTDPDEQLPVTLGQPLQLPTESIRFEQIKDQLIERFLPACMILDEDYQLLHLYGNARQFLTLPNSGKVSVDIRELIQPDLLTLMNSILHLAKTHSGPASKTSLLRNSDSGYSQLLVSAQYFEGKNTENSFFTLIFRDETSTQALSSSDDSSAIPDSTIKMIKELEDQLSNRHEKLQITKDVLQNAGEELQTTNEELMSSNEELQSVNEELQSVNEELYTVNMEHQEKINELLSIKTDLDNVLNAGAVGIVILNSDLTIRKYNNFTQQYFNITTSDLGRPLHDITHTLEHETLFDDIAVTRKSHLGSSCEIQTLKGDRLQLKILPYHSSTIEENEYSAVTIVVTPIESAPASALPAIARSGGAKLTRKPRLRLLIIDDDLTDRRLIHRSLKKIESISIDIFEAHNVASAITSLLHNNVDACLVDYRLNQETAHDLAKRIRTFNENLPIVLMSTYTREELTDRVPDSLLDYYINKREISPLLLELSLRHAISSATSSIPLLTRNDAPHEFSSR